MNTKNTKRQYLLQTWAPIIRDCKNSGMTVKSWCEEHDINEKRFYYWQRRVREELLPVVAENTTATPTFVQVPEVKPTDSSFKPDMVLHYGNLRVELANSASPELLSNVMKVIHHA